MIPLKKESNHKISLVLLYFKQEVKRTNIIFGMQKSSKKNYLRQDIMKLVKKSWGPMEL